MSRPDDAIPASTSGNAATAEPSCAETEVDREDPVLPASTAEALTADALAVGVDALASRWSSPARSTTEPGATSGSAEPRAPVRPTPLAPAEACAARTSSSAVPASKLWGRFVAHVVTKAGVDNPPAAAAGPAWPAATGEPSEGVDAVTAVNVAGSSEAGEVEGASVEEAATLGLPAASVAAPAACVGAQTGGGVRSPASVRDGGGDPGGRGNRRDAWFRRSGPPLYRLARWVRRARPRFRGHREGCWDGTDLGAGFAGIR